MNLVAMDIPDDPARLADWLEQHLLGLDLGRLIAELSAVHPAPADRIFVQEVLGEWLEQVLEKGLNVLPPAVLRQFLRWPGLLLDLQELIFVSGGPYWDERWQAVPELQAEVERGWQRLAAVLNNERHVEETERELLPLRPATPWYRRPWLVSLATAAAVLLGVFAYQRWGPREGPVTPGSVAWGWNKPDAMPGSLPPDVYLERLADEAEEWFTKRPDDAAALAQRINEFRQGCSALIFAPHEPLAAKDRDWLVERCRTWAGKLDQHLAAIEGGTPVEKVRGDMDATVTQIAKVLRARADTLAA